MRFARGQVNIPQAVIGLGVTLVSSAVFWWGGLTWKKAELAEDYRRRMEAQEQNSLRHDRVEDELRAGQLTISLKTEAIRVSVEAQGKEQNAFVAELRSYYRAYRK